MAFINKNRDIDVTAISNVFIDEYMPKANGAFVKVYLYGYKNCCAGNYEITAAQIAQTMDMLESDVILAWKYWEKQGIMKLYFNEETKSYDVEYLEVREVKENIIEKPKLNNILAVKPQYSPKELEIYQQNSKEIRELFEYVKTVMNKLLTYNDMNLIYSIYDWYRLPIDVIKLLFAYHSDKSFRYIEKVAMDWSEKGIDTIEKAEEHMKGFGDYKKIMKAFGVENLDIPKYREYVFKWLKNYKMKIEIIQEAAQRSIFRTGKASMEYADRIIESWYKNNVQNLDDIAKLDKAFEESKKKNIENRENKSLAENKRKDKFVNYEQRNWNFEELEKLEQQLNQI